MHDLIMGISVSIILLFLTGITFGEYHLENTDTASSEFTSIVTTPFFVDKTSLIKTFFEPRRWNVLITAPRRFGKSTNLDMLRRFCEINVDKNGSTIVNEQTESFKVFSKMYNKTDKYEHLDVYKDTNFFQQHFGKYPVIYLDFKRSSCTSEEEFLVSFRRIVRKTFKIHKYLLNSKLLDQEDLDEFKYYCFRKSNKKLKGQDLIDSIEFLSEVLKIHFNRRVIVLIDEYDAPIQEAIFKSGKDLGKIIEFIAKFISNLLKSNPYVERALINACIRLSGVATTDANNIVIYSFCKNHPFAKFYGFTVDEVKGLTKKFNICKNVALIEAWYDGYVVVGSNMKLLNTFSIIRYFESREFSNYWVQTGAIGKLEKMFVDEKIRTIIFNLLNNQTQDIDINDKITVGEVHTLSKLVEEEEYGKLDDNDINLFLVFMLDLGYFTLNNTLCDNQLTIQIPNQEIRKELSRAVWKYYKEKFNLNKDMKEVREYINSIHKLGKDTRTHVKLGESISNLLIKIDTPQNEAEVEHVMAGIPILSTEFTMVRSQLRMKRKTQFSYGYIDILIIKDKGNTGIIFELKYFKMTSKKKYSPYAALQQIIQEEYYMIFDSGLYNVSNKIYVGVILNETDKKTGGMKGVATVLYNSLDLKDNTSVIIDTIN